MFHHSKTRKHQEKAYPNKRFLLKDFYRKNQMNYDTFNMIPAKTKINERNC